MSLQKSAFILPGSSGKRILLDITFDAAAGKRPVILYAHGFNGFKDWGNFDLIAAQFAEAGFTFVKFNFSHNGTTPEQPTDFTDLQAFAENNYTKELFDLGQVIDWTSRPDNEFAGHIDASRIGLIGHSMGGGISILKTAEDERVKALVTWAAIDQCKTPWANWSEEKLAAWKQDSVAYYFNGRTQQQMPMHYQLYEDFQQHSKRLNIIRAAGTIKVPWLICHGSSDTSVSIASADALYQACPAASRFTTDSDHVFGRKHPWPGDMLPEAMQEVIRESLSLFQSAFH